MIPIQYNVRSLLVRRTTTLVTVAGIALVVFVLSAALMLGDGIERTLGGSGRSDYSVVLRKGSDVELTSMIETRHVNLVLAAPGIKKGEGGNPLGAGESLLVILLEKSATDGQVSNVQVRGVADNVFTLRPFVRVVEGRPAQPGTDEVMVGKRLVGRFAGMGIGQAFELKKNRQVTVVGVIEADGSSYESEIWANIDTVNSSFGRTGLVSSITVALEDESKFDGFAAAIEGNKQLQLMAKREDRFFSEQSEGTAVFIRAVGTIISVFFMLAAIIGAFITMNTAVSARRREIGTMLALGFRGRSVMLSFVLEAVLLSLFGAAIGVGAAYFLSFREFSIMNFATWSEIVFSFEMSVGTIVTAVVVGTVMGFLGGFFPAWGAARMRPIDAMRS